MRLLGGQEVCGFPTIAQGGTGCWALPVLNWESFEAGRGYTCHTQTMNGQRTSGDMSIAHGTVLKDKKRKPEPSMTLGGVRPRSVVLFECPWGRGTRSMAGMTLDSRGLPITGM